MDTAPPLEDGQHDVRVVERLVAVAHVDVEHGERVALEPARLDGHGTAFERPFGAVAGHGHAAAWVHPLHAIWVAVGVGVVVVVHSPRARRDACIVFCDGAVGVDVVASPWRVHNHRVRCSERPARSRENQRAQADHAGVCECVCVCVGRQWVRVVERQTGDFKDGEQWKILLLLSSTRQLRKPQGSHTI